MVKRFLKLDLYKIKFDSQYIDKIKDNYFNWKTFLIKIF